MVPRARIELATQRFSVFRSTTELPRQIVIIVFSLPISLASNEPKAASRTNTLREVTEPSQGLKARIQADQAVILTPAGFSRTMPINATLFKPIAIPCVGHYNKLTLTSCQIQEHRVIYAQN